MTHTKRFRFLIGLLILSGSVFVFGCSNKIDQATAATKLSFTDTEAVVIEATQEETPESLSSEIISIDEVWDEYINHRLGFSIKIPKTMYRTDADCYWHEDDSDRSYRPLGGFVPVKVIEGEGKVFITSQFYSVLTQPTQIPSGAGYRTEFDGCQRVENDLELVLNRDYSSYIWEIVVRKINSVEDLEILIDDYYGECFQVGETRPMEKGSLLQVEVKGDGKPVQESECLLRGMYVFLYSPELGRAATWKTGQSMHFVSDPETFDGYDGEMYRNFKFIDE